MNNFIKNIITFFVFSFSLVAMSSAFSGIVLTGSRVIFADGQSEKTIYLQNKDSYPNLVQIWLDEGDEDSSMEDSKAPFVVSPQIFRINPNNGQTIRLRFVGEDAVAKDTESLFYMNFTEFPAIKKQENEANRLMVVFKNRVKVFYRPKDLKGAVTDVAQQLQFKLEKNGTSTQLNIHNPSGYFTNIKQLSLTSDSKSIVIQQNALIAPKSSVIWPIQSNDQISQQSKIKLTIVNDYGVLVTSELSLIL